MVLSALGTEHEMSDANAIVNMMNLYAFMSESVYLLA